MEHGEQILSRVPATTHRKTCPSCQRAVSPDATKCQHCGRWLRLPTNHWLADLSEMPALAQMDLVSRPAPWRELSPSIGFILAIFIIGVGLHFASIGLVGAGGVLIPVCLIGAAILEFRADRIASGTQGDDAMGALSASSDWGAIGANRRRRP